MNPSRPAPRHAALTLAPALVLLLGCASSEEARHAKDVNWLVQHGRFEEAVVRAAEAAADRPRDARAQERWRMASLAWRLEQGRRLTFDGKDEKALDQFEAAVELAPDSEYAVRWRDATLDKLSDRWVGRAIELHASDELESACKSYEMALKYRADNSLATQGLARALLQLNYRAGMGEAYYERGVKALGDWWLEQASHHFASTLKYDESERAEQRRDETASLRAENRVLIAADMEAQGQYGAARNEYRIATLLDPAHAEALAGLERMRVEEQASETLRQAERHRLKGEFEAAQAALEEGAAVTRRQGEVFDAAREQLLYTRLEARYESALAIESDHRYEEAVAAYDALLADAPGGYFADVIARRDTLADFVERARAAYDQALAAEDDARRISLLRQVLLMYPEYKDARQRLEALQAAQATPVEPPASEDGDAIEPECDEPVGAASDEPRG